MRYYATASTDRVRDAIRADLLGQIITPAAGNRHEPWAEWIADNAIYSNAYPGDAAYLGWLRSHVDYRFRCRFAVAPDVVADHNATLERSWPMLRPIREVVGRVALCAQNGATPDDMPWDYIDAVFLAGVIECARCGVVPELASIQRIKDQKVPCRCGRQFSEWKVGDMAAAIAGEAKRRGKWVHMGRVNSEQRLQRARHMGCDSADGTYITYGPDINLIRLLGWLYPGDFRWIRAEQRAAPLMRRPEDSAQGHLFELGQVAA